MTTLIRLPLLPMAMVAVLAIASMTEADGRYHDVRPGHEPEYFQVRVTPSGRFHHHVSVQVAPDQQARARTYDLTLEVRAGHMREMRIALPLREHQGRFTSSAILLPNADVWHGRLVLVERLEGARGGAIYSIDLSSYLGRGEALGLLRGHDRNQQASAEVMAAAEKVFAHEQLVGLNLGTIQMKIGEPHETTTLSGRTVWIYRFHDGQRGVIYRIWWDSTERYAWGVEVVPTQ